MSEQQIQKVKVKRLAHVGLWTTDVVAQARFYRQVLGFDLRNTSNNSSNQDINLENANIFLSLGDEHHSVGLFSDTRPNAGNGRNPFQRTHLHHLSFEVYTDALGFDISDWLLRECAWLRCNNDHHTIMLMQGKMNIDHVGYSIADGPELLKWADYLSRYQTPVLWGPGRHGAGNDLFLRMADAEGLH